MTIVPGTPRWAVVAACAVPACVLPSAVWRVTLLPTGSGSADRYLVTLSAVSMLLALLTLGLVQPWGERLPGGRPVPRAAATGVAVAGASALLLIEFYLVLNAVFGFVERGPVLIGADQPPMPPPGPAVGLLYLPLLAWAPLVLAVAAAYHRRRTRAAASLR